MVLGAVWRSFIRKKHYFFKMSGVSKDAPVGVQWIQRLSGWCCPRLQINRVRWYQASVLVLTYLTYMTYHLTRKPISVVKYQASVLVLTYLTYMTYHLTRKPISVVKYQASVLVLTYLTYMTYHLTRKPISVVKYQASVLVLTYLTYMTYHLTRKPISVVKYQASVLVLTYLTYMTYHLTRKPISVVKSVLHRNCSVLTPPPGVNPGDDTWCDWPPFDTPDANALLGALDSAFLFSYAAAMFVSGLVAERVDLRYFLSLGMLASAIFCYLFGVGYTAGIHSMAYYLLVQAGAGIAQTTGWPGTVAVVGKWFHGKKGLIFGIWNSHTSLGNILGTLLAAAFVEHDWSLSFIYPALTQGVVAILVFLMLVPTPRDVGIIVDSHATSRQHSKPEDEEEPSQVIVGDQAASLRPNRHSTNAPSSEPSETTSLLSERGSASRQAASETRSLLSRGSASSLPPGSAVSLTRALKIPGVVEFSLSLFFAKLISYTFLYWLPSYIATSTNLAPKQSGFVSTVFDAGGVLGAVAAGVLADVSGCPAIVCAAFYAACAPALYLYWCYGGYSYGVNVLLLIIAGALVNAPYALITTAVSAELGTHSSLAGNSHALATVTAIIDGTGSVGAAIGPMLAGVVSSAGSWSHVFYMLIACNVFALLTLLRIVRAEILRLRDERRLASPRLVRIE